MLPGIVDLMDDLMGPVDQAEGSRCPLGFEYT